MKSVLYIRYTNRDDPRLGRHVHHDEESRSYPFRARANGEIVSVKHLRTAPIFDQGQLGSCVPNAGVGTLSYTKYQPTKSGLAYDETTCLEYYRRVTRKDPYAGAWEPDDTGSDGLSMAQVFKAENLIPGYLHIFTPADFMAALMQGPVMVGTVWLNDMFEPDPNGLLSVSGDEAGGHEYVASEYSTGTGLIGFDNSWGLGFGVAGRMFMHRDDFFGLLARDGDATVLLPATAPVPDPVDPAPIPPVADYTARRLAADTKAWRARSVPAVGAKTAQRNLNRYLKEQGL